MLLFVRYETRLSSIHVYTTRGTRVVIGPDIPVFRRRRIYILTQQERTHLHGLGLDHSLAPATSGCQI